MEGQAQPLAELEARAAEQHRPGAGEIVRDGDPVLLGPDLYVDGHRGADPREAELAVQDGLEELLREHLVGQSHAVAPAHVAAAPLDVDDPAEEPQLLGRLLAEVDGQLGALVISRGVSQTRNAPLRLTSRRMATRLEAEGVETWTGSAIGSRGKAPRGRQGLHGRSLRIDFGCLDAHPDIQSGVPMPGAVGNRAVDRPFPSEPGSGKMIRID